LAKTVDRKIIGERYVFLLGIIQFISGDYMALTPTSALTRKELTEKIYKTIEPLTRHDASRILDEFLGEIIDALRHEEDVKLRGFGVFRVHRRKRRIGRNPKTGQDAIITPRRSIKFSSSSYLKAAVNGIPRNIITHKGD
jgi:integration host factor subunit alpha